MHGEHEMLPQDGKLVSARKKMCNTWTVSMEVGWFSTRELAKH